MVNYSPVKLVEYIRDGLIEQEHQGFILKINSNRKVIKIGEDKNYPYYIRSCAKPIQASLIIDYELDKFFDMSSDEIAICCASHTGEDCHVKTVQGFLDKVGIDKSHLKCSLHKPLSKTEQNKLLLAGQQENILQNNCSGKHAMMLAICKKMNWDINNYDNPEHPLQIAIKQKIYELCEIPPIPTLPLKGGGSLTTNSIINKNTNEFKDRLSNSPSPLEGEGWDGGQYPSTKDGCGVPIHSMPLENMVKGYLNLFLDKKYLKIRDAFITNPYLIGGEDRLDTAIMSENDKLVAKVGAGGLCIVINLERAEGLIIKIMDCDMKARAICLIEALKQLKWLDEKALDDDVIKAQYKTDILTLHKEKIGTAKFCFNIA